MIMCVHVRMIQDALAVSLFLPKKYTSHLWLQPFWKLIFDVSYFSHFPTSSDDVAYEVKDV